MKHFILILLCLFLVNFSFAQKKKSKKNTNQNSIVKYDESLYSALKWRNIGPYRGGRSCAVSGVPGKANLFYFGSTGGGIWRSKDGGSNWKNISDGFFGGSIGAIAVSESDNNVIYVGGGEKTVRGNVSFGYGIWKSENAGKTWQNIGLNNSRHIGRIRIHPKNPDLVYVAAMGNLFAPTKERGIYRSKDGGKTWEQILYSNDLSGAVDLIIDPNNPRILYASTWKIQRTPYSLSSGGAGSALWKSTDGGDTWQNISKNKGLPKGTLGIIGIAVSPANSDRVWAMMEAKDGGLFRSDNAGKTWQKVNSSRSLRQRAWYYTRVYADPKDQEIVYVLNVNYHKSTDGGKNFKAYNAPHGDHHDLWIAPENPDRMIIGDDGGAQVTFDGGENWSTYYNQPTAQFYRVTTDNHFPYRIYAAQQDNSTIRILHRTNGGSIGERDWEPTAGGESAHIAIDPTNNNIVYGGSYGGYLTRINHQTKERRAINVYPDNPMGHGAEGMKYRFQWNFPIFFSPHNPKKIYAASNHLHVSEDEGQSWKIISPDLTRNDSTKLKSSGGPITKDNTGVEYYCTIFAAAESPKEKGLIWVGSDDGLIHLTKDAGENWTNVTPPKNQMPEWTMINSIEINPFVDGGCYVAATSYKSGDFKPYLFKTEDYGKTWKKITQGIKNEHFTRVLRADPKQKGLLYAGTETGMYISFDDGEKWKKFQLNLPIVPITDIAIKNDNLIASTQGRGLWLIDDLTPLHQLEKVKEKDFHLYKPLNPYRMGGGQGRARNAGQNHPGGLILYFYLKEKPADSIPVYLTFLENDGDTIRSYSTKSKEKFDKLKLKDSCNYFNWNMRYESAKGFDGMVNWWASLAGPKAIPGTYAVVLQIGEKSQKQEFEILKDPRSSATNADFQAQFDFLMDLSKKVTETHETIGKIRKIKKEIALVNKKIKGKEEFKSLETKANQLDSMLTKVEKTLYQTQNQSRQDPLNFPIRLNNKLAHLNSLMSIGDYPPTAQAIEVKNTLTKAIDAQIEIYWNILKKEIPEFNQMIRDLKLDFISYE